MGLAKVKGVDRKLGSTMKSVGEIMSIGERSLKHLQKASRMVTEQAAGLSMNVFDCSDEDLKQELSNPTDIRLYATIEAFRRGMSLDEVYDLNKNQ